MKIWNPNNGSLIYTLFGHTNSIYKLIIFYSFCPLDFNQAKTEIANIYSTTFNPLRLYITTWDQVAAYDGRITVLFVKFPPIYRNLFSGFIILFPAYIIILLI